MGLLCQAGAPEKVVGFFGLVTEWAFVGLLCVARRNTVRRQPTVLQLPSEGFVFERRGGLLLAYPMPVDFVGVVLREALSEVLVVPWRGGCTRQLGLQVYWYPSFDSKLCRSFRNPILWFQSRMAAPVTFRIVIALTVDSDLMAGLDSRRVRLLAAYVTDLCYGSE